MDVLRPELERREKILFERKKLFKPLAKEDFVERGLMAGGARDAAPGTAEYS
jgi:hypothetical protein